MYRKFKLAFLAFCLLSVNSTFLKAVDVDSMEDQDYSNEINPAFQTDAVYGDGEEVDTENDNSSVASEEDPSLDDLLMEDSEDQESTDQEQDQKDDSWAMPADQEDPVYSDAVYGDGAEDLASSFETDEIEEQDDSNEINPAYQADAVYGDDEEGDN